MPSKNHQAPPPQPKVGSSIRGRGSMRDIKLDLDPRIDLTKPIYEQVLELEKADRAASNKD